MDPTRSSCCMNPRLSTFVVKHYNQLHDEGVCAHFQETLKLKPLASRCSWPGLACRKSSRDNSNRALNLSAHQSSINYAPLF